MNGRLKLLSTRHPGALASLVLALLFISPLWAQNAVQGQKRDIAIILDVSGSMEEGWIIHEVKDWIDKEIVRTIVQPGDRVSVIAFGTSFRRLFSREISGVADLDRLSKDLDSLRTRDHFTDIGAALEGLDRFIDEEADPARSPLAVFITDGKNAPPESSPWRGRNLSLDEHFKDTGRKIARKGWALYVIGLLEDSDAALVAETVPGSSLAVGDKALDAEPFREHVTERDQAAASAREGVAAGTDSAEATDTSTTALETADKTADKGPVYSFDPGIGEQKDNGEVAALPVPLIAVAGGLAFLALTALLVGTGYARRRRLDDDEKPRKKPRRPRKEEAKKKAVKGAKPAAAGDAPFANPDLLAPGPVVASPESDDPFGSFDFK